LRRRGGHVRAAVRSCRGGRVRELPVEDASASRRWSGGHEPPWRPRPRRCPLAPWRSRSLAPPVPPVGPLDPCLDLGLQRRRGGAEGRGRRHGGKALCSGGFELQRLRAEEGGSDEKSRGMGTLLEKIAIGCRSPLLCIT
jgi:hypothetical protein